MAETQVTETSVSTTTETTQEEPQIVEQETEQEEHHSSLLTDILTIVGFAILFIIIIWGLVHLVELIGSSFSANKPAPTIQVNAPAQATSGQPVTISWNYAPTVAGSYAFLYECESGLTFNTKDATSSAAAIPCGVAYTNGATSSAQVTPILSATSSVSDTVSIVFIPQQGGLSAGEAGSQVQGDATMTINPAAKKTVTTAPAKTTTKSTSYSSGSSYNLPTGQAGYSSTNYSGPAQLAVSIISGNIDQYGDGTVTFNIANVGGSPSGSYYFSAQLPTAEPYPYQSPLQAPLAPGAHVVSTLNFTDAASGGGVFSVTIEGSGAYGSSDYASQQLTGPYNLPTGQAGYNSNYGYNDQQPYQQPYVQSPTYTY